MTIPPSVIRSRKFKQVVVGHFLRGPRTGHVLTEMDKFMARHRVQDQLPSTQLRGVIELLCLRTPVENWEFPPELMEQLYPLTSQIGNRK